MRFSSKCNLHRHMTQNHINDKYSVTQVKLWRAQNPFAKYKSFEVTVNK